MADHPDIEPVDDVNDVDEPEYEGDKSEDIHSIDEDHVEHPDVGPVDDVNDVDEPEYEGDKSEDIHSVDEDHVAEHPDVELVDDMDDVDEPEYEEYEEYEEYDSDYVVDESWPPFVQLLEELRMCTEDVVNVPADMFVELVAEILATESPERFAQADVEQLKKHYDKEAIMLYYEEQCNRGLDAQLDREEMQLIRAAFLDDGDCVVDPDFHEKVLDDIVNGNFDDAMQSRKSMWDDNETAKESAEGVPLNGDGDQGDLEEEGTQEDLEEEAVSADADQFDFEREMDEYEKEYEKQLAEAAKEAKQSAKDIDDTLPLTELEILVDVLLDREGVSSTFYQLEDVADHLGQEKSRFGVIVGSDVLVATPGSIFRKGDSTIRSHSIPLGIVGHPPVSKSQNVYLADPIMQDKFVLMPAQNPHNMAMARAVNLDGSLYTLELCHSSKIWAFLGGTFAFQIRNNIVCLVGVSVSPSNFIDSDCVAGTCVFQSIKADQSVIDDFNWGRDVKKSIVVGTAFAAAVGLLGFTAQQMNWWQPE